MKIKTGYNVRCFRYNTGRYKSSQIGIGYYLIDNDIKYYLGDMSFVDDSKEWYNGDENIGIIYEIYKKWFNFSSCYEKNKINELKEKISSNSNNIIGGILEDINNITIELKDYINNDLDKVKSLLLLLVDEFISKHPSELYGNPTETIYDEEYDWVY